MSSALQIRFAGEHRGFVDFDDTAQEKLAQRVTSSSDVVPHMKAAFAQLATALGSLPEVNGRDGRPTVAINRCPNRAYVGAGLDILVRTDRANRIDLSDVFAHSGFVQDGTAPVTGMNIGGVNYSAIPVAYTR